MKNRFTRLGAIVLASAFLLTGCGQLNPEDKLVTITNNGETDSVSLGYAYFVARYNQAVMDQYYGTYLSENMWSEDLYGNGNTMEEDTKNDVLDQLKEEYLCMQHADEYGVQVSDAEVSNIDELAKSFMSENTKKSLEEIGATEEYAKTMMLNQTYAARVKEQVEAEAEGKVTVTDEDANQSTISYVLFSTDDVTNEEGDIVPLTEEEIADLKEQAEKLSASGDFDAIKNDEDTDLRVQTYSYTTAKAAADDDVLGEAVISAAKELKEGEVSSVIEVKDEGYYVIRKDAELDESATASKRDNVKNEKIEEYYNDKIDEWGSAITWTVDENMWKKVEFTDRFVAVAGASSANE